MAHCIPAQARRSHRARDQGMTTVEMVGYLLVVGILLTMGIQMIMWGVAAYGARLAAGHAAQAARVYGSTAAAGQAQGYLMLEGSVGRGLRDAQVTVTRTATTVTARVTGHAKPVFGPALPVTVTVSAPVERPA